MQNTQKPIPSQDFHATAKITPDQGKAAIQFLDALFRGTIEEYWGQLSDVDQVSLHEHYTYIRSTSMNDYDDFADYLEHERMDDRQRFAMLKDNWGYSHTVRYSAAGDAYLYLFENVKGTVTFIAPVAEEVCVLRLTAQTKYVKEQNGYSIGWKVRLVDLDLKTALS